MLTRGRVESLEELAAIVSTPFSLVPKRNQDPLPMITHPFGEGEIGVGSYVPLESPTLIISLQRLISVGTVLSFQAKLSREMARAVLHARGYSALLPQIVSPAQINSSHRESGGPVHRLAWYITA